MKHTPGPWSAEEYDKLSEFSINAAKRQIARTNGHNLDVDEHEANAHLIAAAPELYEALQYIQRWLNETGLDVHQSVPQMINAALAKAEGR